MAELFTVWTPASVVAALVGGGALGLLLVSRFDNPRFHAVESIGVVAFLGVFAGVVFYVGQAVASTITDGPILAARVVSRALLFVLFILAMAAGTGVGVRRSRGGWRT